MAIELVERWKLGVSMGDIVIKTLIAVGVGWIGFIQNGQAQRSKDAEAAAAAERERFNKQTACWNSTRDSIDLILKYCIKPEAVNSMRAQLPKSCSAETQDDVGSFLSTISAERYINCKNLQTEAVVADADQTPPSQTGGAGEGSAGGGAATSGGRGAAGGAEPSGGGSMGGVITSGIGGAQGGSEIGGRIGGGTGAEQQGWVAVGFQNTTDFNFVAPNDKPITAAPKVGDTIKARWSVNVRPGIANWSVVFATLRSGDCFKVSEVDPDVRAGSLLQIWARGTRVQCQ